MKKIYFHADEGSMPLELPDSKFERAKGYIETSKLLNEGVEEIHTTDMCHFSFDLIDRGYEIYLCYGKTSVKIEPGMVVIPGTGKELRRPHMIRRLFIAGVFNEMLGIDVNTCETVLTLESAIEHAKEVAENCDNEKCATEHQQLADWLSELNELRKQQAEQVTATGQQMLRKTLKRFGVNL